MKQVIGYYAAHDANITVYRPEHDDFFTLELERLEKIKHFRPVDLNNQEQVVQDWTEDNDRIYKNVLNIFEEYNIPNNFSTLTWRSRGDVQNFGQNAFVFDQHLRADCYHHDAHTWSAYMQSPFESAFVLSWDGGGDGTCFQVSKIVNGILLESKKYPYEFGPLYIKLLLKEPMFANTLPLDVAGKAMGLSAYGKPHIHLFPHIDKLAKISIDNDIAKQFEKLQQADLTEKWHDLFQYKTICARKDRVLYDRILSEITAEDLTATIQLYIEKRILNLLNISFYDDIQQCDGNLIITGGVALNVLANQKIKEKFPEFNIYVPSNPHDGGLSVGMVYSYLLKNNMIKPGSKYDLSNSGPLLFDINKLDNHLANNKHKIVELDDIVKLLKDGKILGFLQGRMEIGPRALGNRSILCDASYPDMKDIINAKVKFREEYRPFAPMCLKETADEYFEAPNFDNTEYMSYTVNVKDKYKQKLKPITHVDGTARLQTVTQQSNPVIYKLLKKFDGVLLNTSFNIQGQPILNTLEDANENLHRTKLDGYVLFHNDQFLYFYK